MTQPAREDVRGGWLRWVTPDGRRLLLARVLRTFAYGYVAVVLGVYLDRLGLDATRIGIVLTAAIAGSALMTVGWSLYADRYGRRRTISTMAALMALGGLAFALTDSFAILVLAGFTGTISATSSEVGVFQTVDQAMLPQTAPDARRTWLFAVYNTLATFGGALGALFAASVALFERLGLTGADAYRPLFLLYALVGLANLALFASLTDKLELAKVHGDRRFIGIHRSRGTVAKLAALFGLDAFAGGLVVQSLVAYWFYVRWALDPGQLAVLFFTVNVLSGVSLLAAGWLAARFGLLNTMVFSHLPSNVLLMLVPLMPSAPLAVAVFLARMSISQMDVPTRQSYTMAVVDPDERTATAGLTNVARTTSAAFSPLVTGLAFAAGSFALPFVLAGALKVAYDGLLYVTFRGVRPPEEVRPRQ
ncbi:MAG: MFS transporter [Chloroflexota bacterium]|nr:MFS transporter [Chloroflexota bacterium]